MAAPARAAADRDLCVALLALQMSFISREAFIEGFNTWTKDRTKSLGHTLVDCGVLTHTQCERLESLVENHLQKHGDDWESSLAALGVRDFGPLQSRDGNGFDPAAIVAAATGPETIANSPEQASVVFSSADEAWEDSHGENQGTDECRFRDEKFFAEGGVGIVFDAHDTELRRRVALKKLKPEFASDPVNRSRFVREALVTGRLEHPGIVPIYGMGAYADGRPYYAMRFIEGENLLRAVTRFHQVDHEHGKHREHTRELRRLLDRFVAMCNALAFAHSRGVVHRDLKPANVMLGPYGETLVIDWGMAKIDRGNSSDTSTNISAGNDAAKAANASRGQFGTPAYMSPEQAEGKVDQLGPASDVYSLGATLYHILTGKPPFLGGDLESTLAGVKSGDFPRPRKVQPRTSASLEAICLKAMAREPEDRYPTAQVLAEEVQNWLADEPVQAYAEPWQVRASRWMRRRRVALAMISLVLMTALGLAALLMWSVALKEQLKLLGEKQDDFDRLVESADKATVDGNWSLAHEGLSNAENRLAGASSHEQNTKLQAANRLLGMAERLEEIRFEALSQTFQSALTGTSRREIGHVVGEKGDYATTISQHFGRKLPDCLSDPQFAAEVKASPIQTHVLRAIEDWAADEPDLPLCTRLVQFLEANDGTTWRSQSLKLVEPSAELLETEDALVPPQASASAYRFIGHLLFRVPDMPRALEILQQGLEKHSDDESLLADLAVAHELNGRKQTAIEYFRAALMKIPATHRANAYVRGDLGKLMAESGRGPEGVATLQAAIAQSPNSAFLYAHLGFVLLQEANFDEADKAFRQSLRLNPGSAIAARGIGDIPRMKGDFKAAEAAYREALKLDPDSVEIRSNLGATLLMQSQWANAEKELREAIAKGPNYSIPHYNLAQALQNQGNLDAAEDEYRRAIEVDPDNGKAHRVYGVFLSGLGRIIESEEAFRWATMSSLPDVDAPLELAQSLIDRDEFRESGEILAALSKMPKPSADVFRLKGEWNYRHGDLEGAQECFDTAITILKMESGMSWLQKFAQLEKLKQLRQNAVEHAISYQRLIGREETDDEIAFSVAIVCSYKRIFPETGMRLFANFAAKANSQVLADKMSRFYAASCGIQASCPGELALDDATREAWRKQSLAWLQANLAECERRPAPQSFFGQIFAPEQPPLTPKEIGLYLALVKNSDRTAIVRDETFLNSLPADEAAAWKKLWADTSAIEARLQPKPKENG